MKTFYTVRDIEDMHAAGVTEIATHDDVVLTDAAREKAIALGIQLIPLDPADDGRRQPGTPRFAGAPQPNHTPAAVGALPNTLVGPAAPHSLTRDSASTSTNHVMQIKAAVMARLGTDKYNDLLDKIIPQVISQLKK